MAGISHLDWAYPFLVPGCLQVLVQVLPDSMEIFPFEVYGPRLAGLGVWKGWRRGQMGVEVCNS